MMEMPIRLKVVSDPPEPKILGSGSSSSADGDPEAIEFQFFAEGRVGRRYA